LAKTYSGAGFLAGLERAGAADTLTVTGVPAAGSYRLQLRYANGKAGAQPVQSRTVTVNGTPPRSPRPAAGTTQPGTEPGSTKLPDDLYARWVQLGTFQPIDRLHSNHSDRLPWQYGPAARASATKFLRLREHITFSGI